MYSDYTAAFAATKLETLELKLLLKDVNHVMIFSISSKPTYAHSNWYVAMPSEAKR